MSQLTNEQIVNIAQSSVDTVATNIDSVKNNSANIAAILAVWTAMSAIKMAPDAAQSRWPFSRGLRSYSGKVRTNP